MGDRHLLNTIAMLERNAARALAEGIATGYSVLCSLQGEMAQFFCQQDLDRMEETDPYEYLEQRPIYRALVAEADRRKLKRL